MLSTDLCRGEVYQIQLSPLTYICWDTYMDGAAGYPSLTVLWLEFAPYVTVPVFCFVF